jgi:hypothetical protein
MSENKRPIEDSSHQSEVVDPKEIQVDETSTSFHDSKNNQEESNGKTKQETKIDEDPVVEQSFKKAEEKAPKNKGNAEVPFLANTPSAIKDGGFTIATGLANEVVVEQVGVENEMVRHLMPKPVDATYVPRAHYYLKGVVSNALLSLLTEQIKPFQDSTIFSSDATNLAQLLAGAVQNLFQLRAPYFGPYASAISEQIALTTTNQFMAGAGNPASYNALLAQVLNAANVPPQFANTLTTIGNWIFSAANANLFSSVFFMNNINAFTGDPTTQYRQLGSLLTTLGSQGTKNYTELFNQVLRNISLFRLATGPYYSTVGDLVGTAGNANATNINALGNRLSELCERYLGVDNIQEFNEFEVPFTEDDTVVVPIEDWIQAIANIFDPTFAPAVPSVTPRLQVLMNDLAEIIRIHIYASLTRGEDVSGLVAFVQTFTNDIDIRTEDAKRSAKIIAAFKLASLAAMQIVAGSAIDYLSSIFQMSAHTVKRGSDFSISDFPNWGVHSWPSLVPRLGDEKMRVSAQGDAHLGNLSFILSVPIEDRVYGNSAIYSNAIKSIRSVHDGRRIEADLVMHDRASFYVYGLEGRMRLYQQQRIKTDAWDDAPIIDMETIPVGTNGNVNLIRHFIESGNLSDENLHPVIYSNPSAANIRPLYSPNGFFVEGFQVSFTNVFQYLPNNSGGPFVRLIKPHYSVAAPSDWIDIGDGYILEAYVHLNFTLLSRYLAMQPILIVTEYDPLWHPTLPMELKGPILPVSLDTLHTFTGLYEAITSMEPALLALYNLNITAAGVLETTLPGPTRYTVNILKLSAGKDGVVALPSNLTLDPNNCGFSNIRNISFMGFKIRTEVLPQLPVQIYNV